MHNLMMFQLESYFSLRSFIKITYKSDHLKHNMEYTLRNIIQRRICTERKKTCYLKTNKKVQKYNDVHCQFSNCVALFHKMNNNTISSQQSSPSAAAEITTFPDIDVNNTDWQEISMLFEHQRHTLAFDTEAALWTATKSHHNLNFSSPHNLIFNDETVSPNNLIQNWNSTFFNHTALSLGMNESQLAESCSDSLLWVSVLVTTLKVLSMGAVILLSVLGNLLVIVSVVR